MQGQLAAALKVMPRQTLVIIPRGNEYFFPYALQTPFAPTDLYSKVRIIEHPDLYYFRESPRWWEKTKQVLGTEWAGPSDEPIEIHLFAWDERRKSLEHKRRVLPRGLLRTCVTKALGSPLEAVASLNPPEASRLVEALARLVSEGG
jgi:hypothetical protein